MFSFHATKVFNTIEGGALVFNDPSLKARADRMKNFGLLPDGGITEPGTNAKLNEVQAAMGILLLDMVEGEIQKRKEVTADYTAMLSDVPGIGIIKPREGIVYNYPYFVIIVDEDAFGISRDALYDRLKRHNILARRYFILCSNLNATGFAFVRKEAPGGEQSRRFRPGAAVIRRSVS